MRIRGMGRRYSPTGITTTGGTMNDAATPDDGPTIEDYYREDRTFPPSPEFTAQAVLGDPSIYDRAEADPEAFWAEQARDLIRSEERRVGKAWCIPIVP